MHDPAGLQHDQGLDAVTGEAAPAALPVADGGDLSPSEADIGATALERAERAVHDEIERQKAELLALRRQFDALSSRLAQDLRLASMVQRGLQPGPVLHPRLDLAREFLPFREVGGDYYDVVMLPEDRVVVAVGDVMGKGIPAALLAATLTATVRSQIQSGQCLPCEVVSHLNRVFWQVTPPGLFASLFYAVLDLRTGTLDYVNAGHHYPFVLRGEGGAVELVDGGTVLGLTEEASFTRGRLQLGGSDLLVLYSDGITDRSNPAGEMYGLERLEDAALASRNYPARICLYSILGDVQGWSGGTPAEDDATLIVVRMR